MTELNEYECGMLDVLLEAASIQDSLTHKQVMDLFDQDEVVASAMVQILVSEGLIAEDKNDEAIGLPARLVLKPNGETLLQSGGFTRLYGQEQQKLEEGSTGEINPQQQLHAAEEKETEPAVINLQRKVKLLQRLCLLLSILIVVALLAGYRWGHHALTLGHQLK